MPLLPVTKPLVEGQALDAAADYTEVTLATEWVGGYGGVTAGGLVLAAGYTGALIRLLHGQLYTEGDDRPDGLADLLDGEPFVMAPLQRSFWALPAGCGAVTVQYACPSSLHALFEYKTK